MDKKGLFNFNAAIVCLVIIIYFLFFSFIVSSVHTAFPSVNETTSVDYYNSITNKLGHSFNYCDSPRYVWKYGSPVSEVMPYYDEPLLSCSITEGILSSDKCSNFVGCEWKNITTNAWYCWLIGNCNTMETCIGDINASNFSITTSVLGNVAGYSYAAGVNTSSQLSVVADYLNYNTGDSYNSVCSHPVLLLNETLCNYFSCTWTKEIVKAEKINVGTYKSILTMIGNSMNYNYVFGFGGSLDILLGLIFIYIPILILLVAGFYALFGG
jgi:hypothetical protein